MGCLGIRRSECPIKFKDDFLERGGFYIKVRNVSSRIASPDLVASTECRQLIIGNSAECQLQCRTRFLQRSRSLTLQRRANHRR
jgi:hypothetical protein